MVNRVAGSYKIILHPDGPAGQTREINVTAPFWGISMVQEPKKA